ncbi:FMN-binding negative transcriptional regulator [Rhodospirillaceae bacterium LM-1]|nr:FMN-binding negative transcriptional regulator [Rhodospirillaceae bacterium LM-1]
MYTPAHFKEERLPVLQAAIQSSGLAILVSSASHGLEVSHLPLFLEPTEGPFGTLYGHMARANPHANLRNADTDSLAIFQGPHAYVSPSWYETKRQTDKVVPTWNYIAVHAHGRLELADDPVLARSVVEKLTAIHEAQREHPWAVSDAPNDYLQTMLKAILPFRLPISRLEGSWKLSQNKAAEDRAGVIQGLNAEAQELAAAMAKAMP